MIFYFSSLTYQQVISNAIKQSDCVLVGQECRNDIFFLKYVREKNNAFTTLDYLILDISSCEDTDDELLEALDILKIVNDKMRIIILAANRYAGDLFLTKCFQMGIYDLIVTDDFLEILNELKYSLVTGKKYADAIAFKDSHPEEKVIVKEEIKQVVNRVMIGIAGASPRIGVTHNGIILANYLRKRGFMVALVELNASDDFRKIGEFYDEKMMEEQFFTMRGIDYYPAAGPDKLGSVLGKTYNFIIVDFGPYETCDRVTFNKADVRMLICGSKPWELEDINSVFSIADVETMKGYHYCFSFTEQGFENEIREGMSFIDRVYFLPYSENPFRTFDFPGADSILGEYMPIGVAKAGRGFFKRGERNGKKKKEKDSL